MRICLPITMGLVLAAALAAQAEDGAAAKESPGFKVPLDIFEQPPPDPNRAVATVNDQPIRALDLERAAQMRWSRIAPRLSLSERAKAQVRLVPETLEQLVQVEVLRQASEAAVPPATPEELTEARKQILSSLPAGTTLEQMLSAQRIDAAEFERDLARQLRIGKYLEHASQSAPPVTDEQAQEFYRGHPGFFLQPELAVARQILFRVATNAPAAHRASARQRADEARKRALAGEDFQQLVKTLSEASEDTRDKTFSMARGQPAEFRALERVVFDQPLLLVSEAVESPLGIHLVRVEQRLPPRTVPFEEVRDKLLTELTGLARQRAADQALLKLRQEARVVYEVGFGPPLTSSGAPAPSTPAKQP